MGKFLEEVVLKNGTFSVMASRMMNEITSYGVSPESAEIVMGSAIDDLHEYKSVHLFIDKVPNYNDGGTENDVEWGSSIPEYAEHGWLIKYTGMDEYDVVRITKDITYIPVSGEKEYTGGGCWIAEGKTSDGNFFLICYDERSVGIFDADTRDGVDNDFMENHTVHLFTDDSPEANEFIRKFEEFTGENKAETEIEKLKDEIESLKKKNMTLSRTIVNIVNAKKDRCSDGNVSDEDFIRMMESELAVAEDDDGDDGAWDEYCDGEFTVTWKGITAKMSNNSNWAELWSGLAKDYEVYRW